ncbi:MAG: tetratricopeptide repeat protein [Gemmatimonadaceae bacterium]|nr:tetratricopeptide repeat protein [Gemmatimonadaceae bacterium]
MGMALRKEPDRRYGSAEQFAEDVTRWIGRMPVRAQRDTFTYRARQFVRRNRGAVAGATAFVVLLAASGIVASLQARARSRERDTAVREQAMAEDVVRVLTDLLKQSDPRVLPGGDTMRVKSFLDRADTELESLTEQPERQLRLRRVMADVRASRGEYAIAESLLAAAYRRGQTALGARHIEVLRTRQSLARAMFSHRGPQVARPLLDSVLGEMRTTLGTGNDDVASAYVDLATATTNPEVATALIDTSIALRAKIGTGRDSLSIATLLDAQGAQHFVRGEFAEARALFSAALRILDARLPPDHVTRLSTLGNLAATENELANWTAAERLATEILTYERKTTIGAEGVARSLEQLAVIHANLGQFAKAETEERESITQLRTRMDPSHELIDNSLRNLAIIVSAGGKPKAGLALLDSVVARRRMAGDSALAAYMEAQRVPMLLRLGRAREAPASVVALNALLPTLAQASRWHGDAAMYAGMAAMANAQHAVALNRLTAAVARFDARYPRDHPRRAMAHCALGAAMAYQRDSRAAAPHLVPACDRLATWALADSSVAAWGRRAR